MDASRSTPVKTITPVPFHLHTLEGRVEDFADLGCLRCDTDGRASDDCGGRAPSTGMGNA